MLLFQEWFWYTLLLGAVFGASVVGAIWRYVVYLNRIENSPFYVDTDSTFYTRNNRKWQ